MDKEFHYNTIYLLGLAIGLPEEDAYKIAYSSQYVDDNNTEYTVKLPNGETFTNDISQSFDISKRGKELEDMYMSLHFLPTLKFVDNRKCELRSKYVTTPNNDIAKQLLTKACESKDPYILGITLHAYADTWAHQNFSGKFEKFNSSRNLDIFEASVGHMDYLDNPDRVGNIWIDERLIDEKINNNHRFIDAAKHIYRGLVHGLELMPILPWDEFEQRILRIWENNSKKAREVEYMRFAGGLQAGWREYNAQGWLDDAVDVTGAISAKIGFGSSNWYGFQRGVIAYKRWFLGVYNAKIS